MACNPKPKAVENTEKESKVVKMIFETDMGNDVDDALALDMIYKYIEAGKVDLLAISSNKDSKFSSEFIDIMATWYGHAGIPIGIVKNGADCENDAVNYARKVCEMTTDGKPAFTRTLSNYESLPEATRLYRKILAEQPDSSVTLVSVGFSTNLARLLDTPADEYSPLTGKELVAKKIKLTSIMAGHFVENPFAEYNVNKDISAARKVFEEWPTLIAVSPFEVGIEINYPATSIENDFNWGVPHPMVEAYKVYQKMPYDRPTWDLTSVLYAVETDTKYMNESPRGIITIDEKGISHFKEDPNGKHYYFKVTPEQAETIKNHFVKLISQKPAKYQN
ncbi:nucleoside hydrolase [Dysgonomonas sp. Marseille-P4677]|nr:nucleoside hydrolase [Dysgonomonas sp. Marseille-P4677]